MRLTLALLVAAPLFAGTTVETTATQAVIRYDAPSSAACVIDVHETALEYSTGTISTSGSTVTGSGTGWTAAQTGQSMNIANILYVFTYVSATSGTLSPAPPTQSAGTAYKLYPLVHDVDSVLFAGANLDSRSSGTTNGVHRVVVIAPKPGRAYQALDSKWYSRALQAYTLHSYNMCAGTVVGTLPTMNQPLGQSFGLPPPADPGNPGVYAFPTYSWTDRNARVIDPITGFLTRLLDYPDDAFINQNYFNTFFSTATGTNWVNPTNAIDDNSSAAVYSGVGKDPIFLPTGLTNSFPGYANHNYNNPSLNKLNPFFNIWADVPSNVEVALTVDNHNIVPQSSWITHAVDACASNCTGANRWKLFTSPATMLADWFPNTGLATVEMSDFMARSGAVDRTGTTVTWKSGDRFNLNWSAGSKMTINSVEYTLASTNNDQSITLASGAGSDSNKAYTASNAGFLLRNKATTGTINLQYANFEYELTSVIEPGSGGDGDSNNNCSTVTTFFAGEPGFHCINGNVIRWIGKNTMTVNRIGRAKVQFNGSSPFWSSVDCSAYYWDHFDGDTFYCSIPDAGAKMRVLKAVYNGNNADVGPLGGFDTMTYCGSAPCYTVTMLNAVAVEDQARAFDSRWDASFFTNAGSTEMFGFMPTTNAVLFSIRSGGQDTACVIAKMDLATGLVTGVVNTWSVWPLTWSSCHGPQNIVDPTSVIVPATTFRGFYSGTFDGPGNGPYIATITNAVSGTAVQCPAAPSPVPYQVPNWPTGLHCGSLTLNGEPGDPTPYQQSSGTITTSSTTVTFAGTTIPNRTGMQLRVSSVYYPLTYVDSTHGTIPNVLSLGSPTAYVLFLEPVNNPLIGNPAYSFLAKLQIGDIFHIGPAGTDGTGTNGGSYYPNGGGLEIARLIAKSGDGPGAVLTVERGYAGQQGYTPLSSFAAGSTLITLPGGCTFSTQAPCDHTFVDWKITDPLGLNPTGTTLTRDINDLGCCHGTSQNIRVDYGINGTCITPDRDNITGVCHFARSAAIPAVYTTPGVKVNMSPLFHGLIGVGSPNGVDTHPSHAQVIPAPGTPEYNWIGDFRPYLGDSGIFGSPGSPGVNVSGQLWKFTSAQYTRLRPRVLPSFSCCGLSPLLDVSGPGSVLGDTSSQSYEYCIALFINECVTGSAVGDVYINCPQMRLGYSYYPSIAGVDTDVRDMMVADSSMYVNSAVQVGVSKSDPDGAYGRVVSKQSRNKAYVFSNVKESPDGNFMFHWDTNTNGIRTSVLLTKLPPFPAGDSINRNDYVPIPVKLPSAGFNNVIVEFGYDTSLTCTSRADPCIANASSIPTGTTPFAYLSEAPSGLPCSNGCTPVIPAVSQRVIYYKVLYRNASNVVTRIDPMAIAVVR